MEKRIYQYEDNRLLYYQVTVENIIQFMKQKKQNVDQEDKQQKKKYSQDSNKCKHDEAGRGVDRLGQRGQGGI